MTANEAISSWEKIQQGVKEADPDGKKGIQLIHGQGKADPGIHGSLSV